MDNDDDDLALSFDFFNRLLIMSRLLPSLDDKLFMQLFFFHLTACSFVDMIIRLSFVIGDDSTLIIDDNSSNSDHLTNALVATVLFASINDCCSTFDDFIVSKVN